VPDAGPAPLEVQALALGVPPTAICDWDFGDGTTGKGSLVAHTYWSPGRYTITLRVGGQVARATVVAGEPPAR
jgi:PKD repeat protein